MKSYKPSEGQREEAYRVLTEEFTVKPQDHDDWATGYVAATCKAKQCDWAAVGGVVSVENAALAHWMSAHASVSQ